MENESRLWMLRSIPGARGVRIPAELAPIDLNQRMCLDIDGKWFDSRDPSFPLRKLSYTLQWTGYDVLRVEEIGGRAYYLATGFMPADLRVGSSIYSVGVDYDGYEDRLGLAYIRYGSQKRLLGDQAAYLTREVGIAGTPEGRTVLFPLEHFGQMRRLVEAGAVSFAVSGDAYSLRGVFTGTDGTIRRVDEQRRVSIVTAEGDRFSLRHVSEVNRPKERAVGG